MIAPSPNILNNDPNNMDITKKKEIMKNLYTSSKRAQGIY